MTFERYKGFYFDIIFMCVLFMSNLKEVIHKIFKYSEISY